MSFLSAEVTLTNVAIPDVETRHAVPLNGIVEHDFSAVKGMGLSLAAAPVAAEL